MEVENVGENPLNASVNKPIDKKKWIILFSIIGALIVGLIIAIIVVVVVRNNKQPEPVHSELSEYEMSMEYMNVTDEINKEIVELSYDPQAVLDLYLQKIREENDEKVKLLLNKDYYYMMSIYYGEDVKEDVMSGLISIDDRLQVVDTALAIVNRAEYYGEEEIKNKYNEIANNRIGLSEEEINALREEILKSAEEEDNGE